MGRIGGHAGELISGVSGGDDLNCAVRHALGQGRIEGHEIGVDLHRVGVDRGEQRRVLVQSEIDLIERDWAA